MSWDAVEVGLAGEEETVNFGPRNETGYTLYQVDTLASVSPTGTVHKCPSVHGATSIEGFCLAVNSKLLVFDASCCTLHATLTFECRVDTVAWSEGSHFLGIGERSGSFHFAHTTTKQVLFSQELINDTACEDDAKSVFLSVIFTPRNINGSYGLVILSASGTLFQFSNLALEELHKAIERQDFAQVNKLRDAIQLDCVDLRDIHGQYVSGVAVGSHLGAPVFICYGGGEAISIWGKDPNDDNSNCLVAIDSVGPQILGGSRIVKARTTNDGNFLVVLDEKHMLSLWAVDTLVMLQFWPKVMVKDFLLLNVSSVETPGSTKCDDDDYKIVILTTQGEKKRYLQVYSFPVMKQVYSLEVPQKVFLAECPCTQESIYFIEGIADVPYGRDNEISEIKELRVRCLTEALPENRLSRLLHKRRFDAAEIFARQFNLDVELVYKVKTNWLLDLVSPWNYEGNEVTVQSQQAEHFSLAELKDCLTKIKDDDYVAKCCLQAALPTLEETYDILSYARTRISSDRATAGERGRQVLSSVLTEVLEALDRLATFEMALGVAAFSGSRWQEFLTANLMVEVTKCLAQSEVISAVIIWRRHQSTFDAQFCAEKLESLLGSVRQDMSSSAIVPWLRDDLVPFVAKVLPQPGLRVLASWLEQRARNMELSEKDGWPSNALSLANVLLSASKSVSESAFGRGLATPQQFVNQVFGLQATAKALLSGRNNNAGSEDEVHSLMVLVQQLTELVQLHSKYGCKIPLAEFAQETTDTIVFRLLDRVIAAELIPAAIEKNIGPYMEHHGLNRGTLLLEYIKDVIRNSTRALSALSNSLLETRIIAVISCINSKELRCKATLQVMRYATIPWSESVETLVAEAKHAFSMLDNKELEGQYRLVDLKKMLCQYGMRSYQVSHSSRAKEMTRFILTKDQPTAMNDALTVVNAYSHMSESEAYVFRMQRFCLEDKAIKCVDLLESLPEPKAQDYAEQLVLWLCEILKEEPCEEVNGNNEHIATAKAAVVILKFMKRRDMISHLGVSELLHCLKNISALQTEFSVFLSVDEYEDTDVQANLFDKYLGGYLAAGKSDKTKKNASEMCRSDDNVRLSLAKLQRLCKLIGISQFQLRSDLALRAVEREDVSTALDLCRDLSEHVPTPASADTLFKVSHSLCRQMAEAFSFHGSISATPKNVTNQIEELLSRATTYCSPALLCDCLELTKCSSLAKCVYSQCESGDYGFSVQSAAQSSKMDPFNEWTFSDRFREDGLVLDSYVALPLAFTFNMTCVPDCCDHAWQYYQARVPGRAAIRESKEVESGEAMVQSSCLVRTSAAGLNIIRHLQENNLYELALRYVVENLGVCIQHFSTISLGKNQPRTQGEKESAETPVSEQQQIEKISPMLLKMINELTGSLLVKVFQCRTIDHGLALGYLCSIPKEVAFDKLLSGRTFLGQSPEKVLSFTKIGIDFAMLCKEPNLLDKCHKLAVNATWGLKLSKLKLSFKDICNSDYEEKLILLSGLINHPRTDLAMILEFCRSYNLDEDEALLMYVKMQLLPKSDEARLSSSSSSCVAEKASQYREEDRLCSGTEYEGKVRAVVDWISCKNQFIRLLNNVAPQVDAYDYDKIMFILTLIKELTQADAPATVEKGIQLLEYLYNYERKSVPGSYERCFTYSAKKDNNVDKICCDSEQPLSPLSKSRIPCHPLLYGEPWKVIAPELDEETVPKLLGVAKLLKLSSDQMYLTAIQNLFKPELGFTSQPTVDGFPSENSSEVVEANKMKFKFDRVKGMLYSIRNAKMAMATAKWVAKQLPVGEAKIAALKACVDFAKNRTNSCAPEEAEESNVTYTRLSELCRAVQTEHVLHQFNIAEASLMALMSQPAKLICSLYTMYGDREPGASSHFPDVHKCCDEVAAVNDKDISKIRCHLVEFLLWSANKCSLMLPLLSRYLESREHEKWLLHSQNDARTSVSGALLQTGLDEIDVNDEDEKNLRRVTYLLRYNSFDQSVAFLLNIAYKSSSATITNQGRLRALRVMFAVAPGDAIEDVCRKPVASIRQYMESLVCLAELEGLHIQQSLSAFQKCNKEGLVRGLWRNHKHEKKVVRLVADLCLDNNIHDPQLWNSVLQQLLAFGMMKYLRRVLACLAGVSALWQVPCLPHVWRSVLMAPFKSVSPPLSDEEQSLCHKSAALLQKCPLLLDLDIYSIAVQFHKVALPAHALACLVLIPPTSVRQQHIKKLMDTGCALEVLNQLETQRKLGRTLTRVDIVHQEIFRYIEENKHYQVLLGTPYFDALVRYLVLNKSIGGLLIKTLEANRLENAAQLVNLYHQVHPNSTTAPRHYAAGRDLGDFEHLWAFLEINGLLEEAMPFLPQPEELEEQEGVEHRDAAVTGNVNGYDSIVDFPI